MKVKCSRCGEIMSNKKFDSHVCKGKRNLMEIPLELLGKVIAKELTEDEAWAIVDKQK